MNPVAKAALASFVQAQSPQSLAGFAVRLPDWKWMPGMRTTTESRVLWIGPNYVDLAYTYSTDFVQRRSQSRESLEMRGFLPDLEDPATLGCIEALVRDVWEDPTACLESLGLGESVTWGPRGALIECLTGDPVYFNTRAKALVFALALRDLEPRS